MAFDLQKLVDQQMKADAPSSRLSEGTTLDSILQSTKEAFDAQPTQPEPQTGGVVIPADTLGGSEPIPSFIQPVQTTDFTSKLSSIEEQAMAIQEQLNQRKAAENQPPSARDQLQAGFQDLINRDLAGEKAGIRDAFGLAEKEELARNLSNEATRIRRDYEARIREIERNVDGKLKGALQAEIDDATVEGNLLLSEKMFQYSIANGDFQKAQELAQQAISDLEAADARRLRLFETAYKFVQNDLSDSEKLQIQQNFQAQEAEKDAVRAQQIAQFKYDLEAPQRAFENSIKQGNLNLAIQKMNYDRLKDSLETQEEVEKAEQALESRAEKAETIIGKVNEAIEQSKGTGSTGFIGGSTRLIPGTPAYNLDKTVQTIKANLGFQELQAMREASPTGGALGQVAVQELEALQSTIASLEVGQEQEQLQQNLLQVSYHYENWLNASGYSVAPDGTVVKITN